MGQVMNMNKQTYRHTEGFEDVISQDSNGGRAGLSNRKGGYDRSWDRCLQKHVNRSQLPAYKLNQEQNENFDDVKMFARKGGRDASLRSGGEDMRRLLTPGEADEPTPLGDRARSQSVSNLAPMNASGLRLFDAKYENDLPIKHVHGRLLTGPNMRREYQNERALSQYRSNSAMVRSHKKQEGFYDEQDQPLNTHNDRLETHAMGNAAAADQMEVSLLYKANKRAKSKGQTPDNFNQVR